LAVDRLMLELTRILTPDRPHSALSVHAAVQQARLLMGGDCSRQWTVDQLAERVGLAPGYLAGLFAVQLGISPHRYLLERRVEAARRLLTSSDLSVTAVAADVGFSSSQQLARVFRRVLGTSPGEWRHRFSHVGT